MRKTLMTLAAMILCAGAYAQNRIIDTRAAETGTERMLTMHETILSYELVPENRSYSWRPGSSILTEVRNDGIYGISVATGQGHLILGRQKLNEIASCDFSEFPPAKWSSADRLQFMHEGEIVTVDVCSMSVVSRMPVPENAENFTPGAAGWSAFTRGNNLCICDDKGNTYPVTSNKNPDIISGQFASRNEFGITGGIFWAPDGKKLAFYRKDQTKVGKFPLLDINSRTGSLVEISYPMAGMASENVQVGIYDISRNKTSYVRADDFGYDQYLTNVTWSPDGEHILIQVLDRSQKHMKLNLYDAANGRFVKTILEERNDRWVEPQTPLYFLNGHNDRFIYTTDNRDGYKNLYLCDFDGNIERLTRTDADVAYVGQDGKNIFYTSAEVSPVENHLFSISIKGRKVRRLTSDRGWHNISISPDGKAFLDNYSNLQVPRVICAGTTDGRTSRTLFEAADSVTGYGYTEIELGSVKSADGKYDNYYRLIKPRNFDPSKKYPLIVYVYGGPHSQMVKDTYLAELRRWEMYMAQRGYIVYVQDNRGTMNRGAEFEKAIYGQCGQAEMADQMEGVKMLMNLPYVDASRIGVHGWSYGGFMTISLITNYPDIFKVAVAGGPVIDWKWYEVMYGERYMGNPNTNKEGYERVSLIRKAADLKGKLLICQGAIDNVVVWEHSLSFIRECIKNNVQVDYFPYPCAEHNVMGRDRVHLMDKVTLYFEDYL